MLTFRKNPLSAAGTGIAQATPVPCRPQYPPGILGQILLVLGLGEVELGRRPISVVILPRPAAAAPPRSHLRARAPVRLFVAEGVDRRAIGRADIVALAHALGRIVAFPEDAQQVAIGDLAGSKTTSTTSAWPVMPVVVSR
jgi:hypothetical protein